MASQQDKHGKASKANRNYRINGQERGPSPSVGAATKYVRSGGPGRMALRKSKNHGCGSPSAHMGKNGSRAH